MSSLTGYLSLDGTDLSYIFHSKTNFNFNNVITPNLGIIGPSTNITTTTGMIGHVSSILVNTSIAITSGTITNLGSTTIEIGVYLCFINGYNTYAGSGRLTSFYLGISSTSGATSADGFWISILQSIVLPASVNKFIIGNTLQPLIVTTSKLYYVIQQITTTGVTSLTNSPNGNGQSYLTIVRIA
jgi:hypothetical protein